MEGIRLISKLEDFSLATPTTAPNSTGIPPSPSAVRRRASSKPPRELIIYVAKLAVLFLAFSFPNFFLVCVGQPVFLPAFLGFVFAPNWANQKDFCTFQSTIGSVGVSSSTRLDAGICCCCAISST